MYRAERNCHEIRTFGGEEEDECEAGRRGRDEEGYEGGNKAESKARGEIGCCGKG